MRAAWDRQRDIACCVAPGHGGPTEAFAVPLATARRLLCDAAIEGIIFDRDGNPLELGRQLRFPNRRQRRALWLRDGGCRFPGCTHRGWLDAHHIIHWIDQGDTLLFNLVLLCRTHHRVVHEAGWQLVGNPGGDLTFVRPNGTRIDAAPPVFHGCADDVDDLGHTEADGRSRWEGDDLDLDYAISALLDNDDLRQRRRDAAEAASSTSTECS